jgi:hypothetical protein
MARVTERPSHTTVAGSVVIAGSVLTVLVVAEQLGGLYSLESREAVADFLSEPAGSTLPLDVPEALALIRIALMVVAGCATAAAVLGYHVLRRSRSARLGLTVVAVPLFLLGPVAGGFLTSLVAAATALLWLGASRAWFDGTVERRDRRSSLATPPQRVSVPPEHHQSPFPAGPPHTTAPPPGWPAPSRPTTVTGRRPDAVVWACVITWASCALVLAGSAASLTLLVSDSAFVWEEVRRQNPELVAGSEVDRDAVLRTTYAVLAVIAVWSLVASVLAGLVLRRSAGARVALAVSAGVAAGLCLTGALFSLAMLVPAAACLATLALLVRPEVRAWFAVPPRDRGPMQP